MRGRKTVEEEEEEEDKNKPTLQSLNMSIHDRKHGRVDEVREQIRALVIMHLFNHAYKIRRSG